MMSNQQEKEDPLFQALPPLSKRPEWGIMLPESHPPASISRPIRPPLSHVRDDAPVARSRSPAADLDTPNLVVSDRAEPDHDRSTSSRSLYGPLRGRNTLRDRPRDAHDPYGMSRYHSIHNNARTSYPVNSNTTMHNFPACNPLPDTPAFAHSAHGYPTQYALRFPPSEWNQEGLPGQPDPYPNYLQGQSIASPSVTSAAVPTTRMITAPAPTPATPAPAPAPPITPAAPATRSRAKERTSTANAQVIRSTRSTRSGAKVQPTSTVDSQTIRSTRSGARKQSTSTAKSQAIRSTRSTRSGARKKSTLTAKSASEEEEKHVPWHDRLEYGCDRREMTEEELALARDGYGTIIPRKDCFKNAELGAKKPVECTMTESDFVWTHRGAEGAKQRRTFHARSSVALEDRLKAKARMDAMFAAQRAEVVAVNAAESAENREMVDDDSASPESSFYSASEGEGEDEDEDMEEE
ncbi:hypothetical protein BOTCAL_0182g00110 [Botryotinia calthae]|uniref:Uncharacterized protein n=1 Tax=Botryotinia calthae TaxID=38488 RepID=A0A4Y8D0N6_9HELO|nr:hypothetical protein BOTCAL_0182g00110 [Botryotinia calthae]